MPSFSGTETAAGPITNGSGVNTLFYDSSSAGSATITTNGGGNTGFFNTSRGGSATLTTNVGGNTYFFDSSTAEGATLTTNTGGTLIFEHGSRAGTATLLNTGGIANFYVASTAENATITNTNGGGTAFYDASTAGAAKIANQTGGVTVFYDATKGGSAAITNASGSGTVFRGTSTADEAAITSNSGGVTAFHDLSSAGTASAGLTINSGGETRFYNSSTAGQATLTVNSGGHAYFFDKSTAGSARLVAAGGVVDFSYTSGLSGDHRISAGSIEGSGTFYLGSNALTVGSLGTSTSVSGSIRDGGVAGGADASLVKVGAGTLTLSGTNSYTGGTILSGGTLVLDSAQAAGTDAISFTGGSQTLRLTAAALGGAGGTYANTLADLGHGDVLDLRGLAYAPGAAVAYGGGTLTVTSGGAHESFILGGSYAGLTFQAVSDGSGGVAVQVLDPAPTVAGVTASTADGAYNAGDVIAIRVVMSEAVTVTGTPQLVLAVGATGRVLDLAGVTDGHVLTFTYTVQAGDAAADLDYRDADALTLNGGTIRDAAGNDAVLTLATPGQSGSISHGKALVVDTAAPAVTSVQVPAGGTYAIDGALVFTVNFSEAVTLTGTASTLSLTIGGTAVEAAYLSHTTTSITYRYGVREGQVDADGIAIGSLDLKTSTLTDTAGNAADLTLRGVGSTQAVVVEAVRPTVTSIVRQAPAEGITNADTLVYRVTFSEAVSGVDALDFAVDGTSAAPAVAPVSGSAYDVTVSGGNLAGLNGPVALSFAPGRTIADAAGNALASTTPTGTNDAGTLVDNTAPTVAISLSDTALRAGETATVTFTFSEAPAGFGAEDVVLADANGTLGPITVDPLNAKVHTATFTPAAGVEDVANAITVGTGWTDAAGNGPAGSTPSVNYGIDTRLPSAAVAMGRTSFTPGQSTTVTFTFSEAPVGFALEDVTAENGTLSDLAATADAKVFTATFTAATGVLDAANLITLGTGWSDAAGNAPAAGVTSAPYALDTRVAAALATPDLVEASDTGTSDADDVTGDTTPAFSGAGANAGALVRLYADGTLVGTGTADPAGLWSITASALAAGTYAITARQVDAAGHEGPASAGLAVTISPQVDGVVVEATTETNETGQTVEVITIPVVTGTRQEQNTTTPAADIPLVTTDGQVVLSVGVPAGFGLRVENATGATGAEGLIQAIQARTEAGSEVRHTFTQAGAAFLAGLEPGTTLTVRTLVPTVSGSTAPTEPLVVKGQAGPSGQQEALVIDARGLPPGTVIELENVEFAVIVGAVTVTGGAGPQVVFGDGARQRIVLGADDDELHGGGGDDVIGSHAGEDRLFGDDGDDLVAGGEGDDQLWGGTGRDQLKGEAGNDVLSGDEGRDLLWGGDGGDRLLGGDGHDRLKGGRGDDHLEGGLGRDVLTGGEGADTFDFTRIEDDAAGRLRDAIRDFRSGEDTISLRGVDADATEGADQRFAWADGSDLDAAFTGAAGELRFANGVLMGDTDGDGRADFRIRVQGSLAAEDVIL